MILLHAVGQGDSAHCSSTDELLGSCISSTGMLVGGIRGLVQPMCMCVHPIGHGRQHMLLFVACGPGAFDWEGCAWHNGSGAVM